MGSGRFLGVWCRGSVILRVEVSVAGFPVCDEEFEATAEHMRRLKWNQGVPGNRPAWSQKQVRMNVADVANFTVAQDGEEAGDGGRRHPDRDAGASDIFTQDASKSCLPKNIWTRGRLWSAVERKSRQTLPDAGAACPAAHTTPAVQEPTY